MDIYFVPSGSVYGKRTSGHLTLSLDSTPTVYTTCNWHVIPPSDAGIMYVEQTVTGFSKYIATMHS